MNTAWICFSLLKLAQDTAICISQGEAGAPIEKNVEISR